MSLSQHCPNFQICNVHSLLLTGNPTGEPSTEFKYFTTSQTSSWFSWIKREDWKWSRFLTIQHSFCGSVTRSLEWVRSASHILQIYISLQRKECGQGNHKNWTLPLGAVLVSSAELWMTDACSDDRGWGRFRDHRLWQAFMINKIWFCMIEEVSKSKVISAPAC